jgi:hypothetical protein
MSQNSNIDQITAWLGAWIQTVDFKLPGRGQGLGEDIVHAIAGGMQKRASQDQSDADGNPWAPNSTTPSKWYPQGYAAWKEQNYGWVDQPGYRTGQTWSLLNLIGTTTIGTHEIIMRGGLPSAPSTSAAPTGLLSAQDAKATGLDKLRWAHESTANKPARGGYAIADADVTEVMVLCTESVTAYVVATNNS